MIRYYDTEAAYSADKKSSLNSQVSFVNDSRMAHFDGRNIVVGIVSARTGSVVYLDEENAMRFIAPSSFSAESFPAGNTIIGVVAIGVDHPDYRGKIAILKKDFKSIAWSYIYSFRLSGYELDGSEHSGIISAYDASDWNVAREYTVTYSATTVDQLAAQLNSFFKTNAPFTTQDWVAQVNDGEIDLVFHYINTAQRNDSGKDGFALSANLLPEIKSSSSMLRMNGQRSGEGTITNMDRALTYFRSDITSTTYNPTSPVTSPKRSYPICLPAYLGISAHSGGDKCAVLREIYGEGEEGWMRFMESFLPVRPSNYGHMGDKNTYGDGKKNTYIMAGREFIGQDGTSHVAFPAADECANTEFNHSLAGKGSWILPDIDLVFSIVKVIKYGTNASRDADPINKALNAIGGSSLSNGSIVWSSSRGSTYGAWLSYGTSGCAGYGIMYSANLALPLLLLDVREATS